MSLVWGTDAMIESHRFINAKLNQEGLPPLSYIIVAYVVI
jgi:hypothetical protein